MPWCPKCGCEYREGFATCADCGIALADAPPAGPLQEGWHLNLPGSHTPGEFGDPALLLTLYDDMEADVYISLLTAENSPTFKKYPKTSGLFKIYTGSGLMGVDLYVPSEKLAEAKALLDAADSEPGIGE